MQTFQQLKKNLKRPRKGLHPVRVALLGDHATQLLAQALEGYGVEAGYDFQLFEADYNQMERQAFDLGSELYAHRPEFVVLVPSAQKLWRKFCTLPPEERPAFAEAQARRFEELYQHIARGSGARVVLCNFAPLDDAVFGQFAGKLPNSFPFQLHTLNHRLMELAARLNNLFLCDVAGLQGRLGAQQCFDPKLYVTADMVFSLDILPHLAKAITDIVAAVSGRFKKCLILDLDNTCWGGVIGDDGLENIQIGDLGIGKAFTELQLWAKELKQRGVILAVCSKNTEHIAREPFEKHPDMVLRLDDIAVFVANWENKADNIRHIQSILNIGFDSMVFLDDNPFERNLVRQNIPELTVPELPEDPADYLPYLRSLNLFETASFSENDQKRTRQYQLEARRRSFAQRFTDENEFLRSLEMRSEVKPFDDFSIPRVAQLTQRSNQFNLRTVRFTEEEIRAIARSERHLTLSFSLEDKFGEHGLISVLILEKRDGGALFIDTWIMSCRVLKRGMEHFVLNQLVDLARRNGFTKLVGEYLPTPKNGIVAEHYPNLGFQPVGGLWELDLEAYTEKPTFIAPKKAVPA